MFVSKRKVLIFSQKIPLIFGLVVISIAGASAEADNSKPAPTIMFMPTVVPSETGTTAPSAVRQLAPHAVRQPASAHTLSPPPPPPPVTDTPSVMRMPSVLVPVPVKTTAAYGNKSLWFQYLQGGEIASQKGDQNLARRYWLGALKALEEAPRGNALTLIQISSLEKHLIDIYSTALGTSSLDKDMRVKLTEEQVKIYGRITELNKKFVAPDNLFVVRSQERFVKASADLKQAKEEAAKEEAAKEESRTGSQ
jgi:hypothetical protein